MGFGKAAVRSEAAVVDQQDPTRGRRAAEELPDLADRPLDVGGAPTGRT
jgi:hypothetical protein